MTLTGGDEYGAQMIGFDPDKDIAVLQLQIPDEDKVGSFRCCI